MIKDKNYFLFFSLLIAGAVGGCSMVLIELIPFIDELLGGYGIVLSMGLAMLFVALVYEKKSMKIVLLEIGLMAVGVIGTLLSWRYEYFLQWLSGLLVLTVMLIFIDTKNKKDNHESF